jgi:hypothetical protein
MNGLKYLLIPALFLGIFLSLAPVFADNGSVSQHAALVTKAVGSSGAPAVYEPVRGYRNYGYSHHSGWNHGRGGHGWRGGHGRSYFYGAPYYGRPYYSYDYGYPYDYYYGAPLGFSFSVPFFGFHIG